MRETNNDLPLFLIAAIIILTPVNSSQAVQCGECRIKQTSSECFKLIEDGIDSYEEPLGLGQQCSSLNLSEPHLIYNCESKESQQCSLNSHILSENIHRQATEELGKFINHFIKSTKTSGLNVQKWCTCKQNKNYQSNGFNVQSRYLQKDEAAKEDTNDKGDKDELIKVKNEYTGEACGSTCAIIIFSSFGGFILLAIVIIVILAACRRDQDGIVHYPPPPPDQPPVQEPGFQMQPQPFQPAQPVYGIPEQPQPGSERQFQNQTNPW